MGAFADKYAPKGDAKVMPDPIPHQLRDEPVSIASQGVRTTRMREEEQKEGAKLDPREEVATHVSKSGVVGLREDFVENPEKVARDKAEVEAMQHQSKQEEIVRKRNAVQAGETPEETAKRETERAKAAEAKHPAQPVHATATVDSKK